MLKGIPDDRDGLFDTIQRSKNHYQKSLSVYQMHGGSFQQLFSGLPNSPGELDNERLCM